MLLREYAIKRWFVIPPLLANVSALPGETRTPEIVTFQSCCVACFENDTDLACCIKPVTCKSQVQCPTNSATKSWNRNTDSKSTSVNNVTSLTLTYSSETCVAMYQLRQHCVHQSDQSFSTYKTMTSLIHAPLTSDLYVQSCQYIQSVH